VFLPLQLEAAIRSGDIEGFMLIEKAWNLFFPSAAKEKDAYHGNKTDPIGTVQYTEVYISDSCNLCSHSLLSFSCIRFRAADPTKEYHQRTSLEKGSAIQISSRGGLMIPSTRSEINQTGIDHTKAQSTISASLDKVLGDVSAIRMPCCRRRNCSGVAAALFFNWMNLHHFFSLFRTRS
jgi:hypothetical protein